MSSQQSFHKELGKERFLQEKRMNYYFRLEMKTMSKQTEETGRKRYEAERHSLVLWLNAAQCQQHRADLTGRMNQYGD